jgi:hypothetical protein
MGQQHGTDPLAPMTLVDGQPSNVHRRQGMSRGSRGQLPRKFIEGNGARRERDESHDKVVQEGHMGLAGPAALMLARIHLQVLIKGRMA